MINAQFSPTFHTTAPTVRVGPTPIRITATPKLTLDEARELIEQLEAAVHEAEQHLPLVQVQFSGGSNRIYTYIDPSGTVEVGDLVEVDTVFGPGNIAKVVGLGKGDHPYQGPFKPITSKLKREVLA